jgi:hypothetical protein
MCEIHRLLIRDRNLYQYLGKQKCELHNQIMMKDTNYNIGSFCFGDYFCMRERNDNRTQIDLKTNSN